MKSILTDIMGTTSPIGSLKILMKDFTDNGVQYIKNAGPEALAVIEGIKKEAGLESAEQIVKYVEGQLAKRNLKPAYLALSGMVNVDGYRTGKLKGEVFDDVPGAFARWKDNGNGIYVYSNGSEESQKLFFKATKQGDLRQLINGYFDTAKVGSKTESDSYKKISDVIQQSPSEMLFLSDLLSEIEAADKAGCGVKLVIRPGNKPIEENKYDKVTSFDDI